MPSSFLTSKPKPKVKVCAYCYSQHGMDTQGFHSIRMDAWFCHKYCHNMALITTGEMRQTDNPEYYKHLISSRDKVFPNNKIQRNRQKLREDIRYKQINVIKNVYETSYEQDHEPDILPEKFH
tara:strand:- start:2263 stop:2631 length:369 start_codon:yes stop_codon:yes gene_type:complete